MTVSFCRRRDISPAFYHAENKGSRNIDALLDSVQFSLLQAFVSSGKPVLGICKGIQLINVAFGGTLIQDLSAESLAIQAWAEADKIHISKAAPGTFPAQLYGSAPRVNSAHHQAVGTVGDELRIAQYGPDFVVEALYHERLPIIGVQWASGTDVLFLCAGRYGGRQPPIILFSFSLNLDNFFPSL